MTPSEGELQEPEFCSTGIKELDDRLRLELLRAAATRWLEERNHRQAKIDAANAAATAEAAKAQRIAAQEVLNMMTVHISGPSTATLVNIAGEAGSSGEPVVGTSEMAGILRPEGQDILSEQAAAIFTRLGVAPYDAADGEVLRPILDGTGLDATVLGEMWASVDVLRDGALTLPQLARLLGLIALAQHGVSGDSPSSHLDAEYPATISGFELTRSTGPGGTEVNADSMPEPDDSDSPSTEAAPAGYAFKSPSNQPKDLLDDKAWDLWVASEREILNDLRRRLEVALAVDSRLDAVESIVTPIAGWTALIEKREAQVDDVVTNRASTRIAAKLLKAAVQRWRHRKHTEMDELARLGRVESVREAATLADTADRDAAITLLKIVIDDAVNYSKESPELNPDIVRLQARLKDLVDQQEAEKRLEAEKAAAAVTIQKAVRKWFAWRGEEIARAEYRIKIQGVVQMGNAALGIEGKDAIGLLTLAIANFEKLEVGDTFDGRDYGFDGLYLWRRELKAREALFPAEARRVLLEQLRSAADDAQALIASNDDATALAAVVDEVRALIRNDSTPNELSDNDAEHGGDKESAHCRSELAIAADLKRWEKTLEAAKSRALVRRGRALVGDESSDLKALDAVIAEGYAMEIPELEAEIAQWEVERHGRQRSLDIQALCARAQDHLQGPLSELVKVIADARSLGDDDLEAELKEWEAAADLLGKNPGFRVVITMPPSQIESGAALPVEYTDVLSLCPTVIRGRVLPGSKTGAARLVREDDDGREGGSISKQPRWFFSGMSREEAEAKMLDPYLETGVFLLRDSVSWPGTFALWGLLLFPLCM